MRNRVVMRNRTVAVMLAGVATALTLVLSAGVAGAQGGPYGAPPFFSSAVRTGPYTFEFGVKGFRPFTPVGFNWICCGSGGGRSAVARAASGDLGSAVADASGSATISATFPSTVSGPVTVTATGVNSDGAPISVSTVVTVGASSGGSGTTSGSGAESGLAFTGSNTPSVLLRAGVLALLLGAVAVFLARRNTARDAA